MFRRFRSARTGRYTTPADAKSNRDTTVSEHDQRVAQAVPTIVMRALEQSLRVNGVDNTLERLAD